MAEDETDICSKQNIEINDDIKYIQSKDISNVDDDMIQVLMIV